MKIVLASNNKKKIEELRRILKEISPRAELFSLSDVGYTGDITEDGSTFEENAIIKASVPASLGYIGIADDSGLCVDALGGAPGIYSARYSGEGHTDEKNNAKLLCELYGKGADERGAHYICAVACVFPESMKIEPIISVGRCDGVITEVESGSGGFGYDPLFYSTEAKKTFAELSAEEKDGISHRGKALREFISLAKPVFDLIYKDLI